MCVALLQVDICIRRTVNNSMVFTWQIILYNIFLKYMTVNQQEFKIYILLQHYNISIEKFNI